MLLLADSNQVFHDYEIIWMPGNIKWFVDGEKYYEVNYTPQFTSDSKYYEAFPFDHDFFLILNLAIGGDWGGAQGIDQSIFPATFQVDYVRVYQMDYGTVDKKSPDKVVNIANAKVKDTIHWNRAEDDFGISKYAVYVDGELNGYANLNQFTLKNILPNKTYDITIEAIDFAGRTSKLSDVYTYMS